MAADGSIGLHATANVASVDAGARRPVLSLPRQRASKHLALIKRHLGGASLRARGEAIGLAVGVTEQELLIGRARWFGSRLERFSLRRVIHLRTIRSRDVDVLQVTLSGLPLEYVTVLYPPQSRPAFDNILAILESRVTPRQLRKRRRLVPIFQHSARSQAARTSAPGMTLRLVAPIEPLTPRHRRDLRHWCGSGLASCFVSAIINVLSLT